VFSGRVSLLEVALLSIVLGVSSAFEVTTRHAFAIDLVGRADLDSAIALNSITINGSRVVGPALGGLLIPILGEAGCFALNGMSYLAIIYGLLLMKLPRHEIPEGDRVKPWQDLVDGLAYLRLEPRIVRLLAIAALLTFLGYPYKSSQSASPGSAPPLSHWHSRRGSGFRWWRASSRASSPWAGFF
jgi:hypothetical protein